MKKMLLAYLKGLPVELLLMIPVSAIIAGIIYFFSVVIFQEEFRYVEILRVTYLTATALSLAYGLIRTSIAILLSAMIAKKVGLTTDEVQAAFRLKLHKKMNPYEWDSEWVRSQLEISQAAEKIVESIRGLR